MSAAHCACRICGVAGEFPVYAVREMMFGTRETFTYFKCASCGCLQIAEVPDDLTRHYPDDYYSLLTPPDGRLPTPLHRWLQKQRARTAIFGRGYRVNALAKRFVDLPDALYRRQGGLTTGEVLKKAGVHSFSARCLDVGCGSFSYWLDHLRQLGFFNLTGVDPHIKSNQRYGPIQILKGEIQEIKGEFDVITLHHSLEHIPEQLDTLNSIRNLLVPTGTCLIRIPIVSSLIWETYGVDWVELDAPRHLYLHSIESITTIAKQAHLDLYDVAYDSTSFEFYGSEQYRRDIPLNDPQSLWMNPESSLFTQAEREEFTMLAERVNMEFKGGRAGFYFRPRIK